MFIISFIFIFLNGEYGNEKNERAPNLNPIQGKVFTRQIKRYSIREECEYVLASL